MKTAVVLASALAFAAPLVPATAMAQEAPLVRVAPSAQGQWVQLGDGSWIFVPLNASTYVAGGVPYVYIYTPAYGWNWYAAPWGAGPFVYGGAWRTHYQGGHQAGGHAYGGGHAAGGHASGGHGGRR